MAQCSHHCTRLSTESFRQHSKSGSHCHTTLVHSKRTTQTVSTVQYQCSTLKSPRCTSYCHNIPRLVTVSTERNLGSMCRSRCSRLRNRNTRTTTDSCDESYLRSRCTRAGYRAPCHSMLTTLEVRYHRYTNQLCCRKHRYRNMRAPRSVSGA